MSTDSTARILVVDDDDTLRRVVTRVLIRAGHNVTEARDGVEAERSCESELPDLVVLDIYMPGRDGIETLLAIRERWPSLPVLVTSGGDEVGYRGNLDDALAFGATASISKPFEMSDLISRVAECLAGR